ncbi:hypothetical protein COO92_06880 [Thalassospira lohafexi]|uniref:Uncharacterized protein n=1 Tax=Thalassospira lohafexi TaxID=744227 RepID=A0A2N3LAG5_9PROT|nr:hypothetical protein COO92_06880 [Thalassospira lohafexi]
MKYATVKGYVRRWRFSSRTKLICCLFVFVYLISPVFAGFLIHANVLEHNVVYDLIFASVFVIFTSMSPRRRLMLRIIAMRPRMRSWQRRSCPWCHFIFLHFGFGLLLLVYKVIAQNGKYWLLPFVALLLAAIVGLMLVFWRPLILRALFGFDRRTKVFGVLK